MMGRGFASFRERIEEFEQRLASSSPVVDTVLKTLRVYTGGVKLLYGDVKEWRMLRGKELRVWRDVAKRERIQSDVLTAVPLLLVFVVPVVGNTVPLLGYFFPFILPSVWVSPKQRVRSILEFEGDVSERARA